MKRYDKLQRDRSTVYPLGDHISGAELARLRKESGKPVKVHDYGGEGFFVGAVWTGEKRATSRGEWRLSGAYVTAYRGGSDYPYHVARLVVFERRLIEKILLQ